MDDESSNDFPTIENCDPTQTVDYDKIGKKSDEMNVISQNEKFLAEEKKNGIINEKPNNEPVNVNNEKIRNYQDEIINASLDENFLSGEKNFETVNEKLAGEPEINNDKIYNEQDKVSKTLDENFLSREKNNTKVNEKPNSELDINTEETNNTIINEKHNSELKVNSEEKNNEEDENKKDSVNENFLSEEKNHEINDKTNSEVEDVNDEENDSTETIESQKDDELLSPRSLLDSLDLEVPSSYEVEPVDFPRSPWFSIKKDSIVNPILNDEEDRSIYQAQMLSNCQDVRLLKDETVTASGKKKKIIPVGNDIFTDSYCDESSFDGSHTSLDEHDLDTYLDSPDELDDSIMERLGKEVEPIPELTAEEERNECRYWKSCCVGGVERRIDLKVLEPYKKVISHGGYLSEESHNAIIIFSACYLPDRSRVDYEYVMNNLFMYVVTTLDQLVTDDYVLIYLHGATSRNCMPKFKWLRQCYQIIDRKLKKNLKGLYLVHPTFWLKTLVLMTKPFISSKFSKKLFFVYSLKELFRMIPLEPTSIPDRVKKYDELKESLENNH